MKDTLKLTPWGAPYIHGADHEVCVEFPSDGQLFFVVVRESHGEVELLTISSAHSSTEANPEGVEFTLDITLLDTPLALGRRLAEMDETTAGRVREILDTPLEDILSTTALLSDI